MRERGTVREAIFTGKLASNQADMLCVCVGVCVGVHVATGASIVKRGALKTALSRQKQKI